MTGRVLPDRVERQRRHGERDAVEDNGGSLAVSAAQRPGKHGRGERKERHGGLARLAKRSRGSRLSAITRRRILYWLAVMVAVLVVGTIIGLIWADTSDVAGFIAVATNIIGVVGIIALVIALVVVTRRQRRLS